MSSSYQGGIDQVRIITRFLSFDQVHPRHRILMPNADHGAMEDLVLSVHGALNPYIAAGGALFHWPDSVVIEIIGQMGETAYSNNVTQSLVAEIQRLLDLQDRSVVMKGYAAGMAAWLQYAETYLATAGLQYTPAIVEHDRKMASTLVEARSPSQLITQLGDRSVGFGGSLHIFNYLYDYIPLPEISLKDILGNNKVALSRFSAVGIECEQPVSDGNISRVAGALVVTLEATIHNPLRDQLADLQSTITTSLSEIDQRLGINGDIMQSLANAYDQLVALRAAIGTCEDHLTSSLAEVKQVKTSVAGLIQKIDGVMEKPRVGPNQSPG